MIFHPQKTSQKLPHVKGQPLRVDNMDKVVRGLSGPPVAAAPFPRGRDFMGALFGGIRIEIEDRT